MKLLDSLTNDFQNNPAGQAIAAKAQAATARALASELADLRRQLAQVEEAQRAHVATYDTTVGPLVEAERDLETRLAKARDARILAACAHQTRKDELYSRESSIRNHLFEANRERVVAFRDRLNRLIEATWAARDETFGTNVLGGLIRTWTNQPTVTSRMAAIRALQQIAGEVLPFEGLNDADWDARCQGLIETLPAVDQRAWAAQTATGGDHVDLRA